MEAGQPYGTRRTVLLHVSNGAAGYAVRNVVYFRNAAVSVRGYVAVPITITSAYGRVSTADCLYITGEAKA